MARKGRPDALQPAAHRQASSSLQGLVKRAAYEELGAGTRSGPDLASYDRAFIVTGEGGK